MVHLDVKASVIGVTDSDGSKYGANWPRGINLQVPNDIEILVGGSFAPSLSSFVGQMKQLEIYIPSKANFTNARSGYKTMSASLRKRGAARKPDNLHQTSLHSAVINHILPNNTITPVHSHGLSPNKTSIVQLENAVYRCESEVTSMKQQILILQQSLNQVQHRITHLESCECNQRCQGADGRYHNNESTWSENECLTCTCNGGMVSCESLPSCGNTGVCDSFPCNNQGICEETNSGFQCQCQNGYHGSLCEHVDHCQRAICQNGGKCTSTDSQYQCDCLSGYRGRHCEMVDWCTQTPCENGGMCINTDQGRECQCHVGFTGENCQHQDLCLPSPCENNGRCKQEIDSSGNSFQCLCQDGFVGDRCEMVDSCADEPCMNGAQCRNTLDGFSCSCALHYTGRLCETYDVCHSFPCLNDGQCEPAVEINGLDYQCICPPTHSGVLCELVNHCSSNPCMHNGVCTNLETGFLCRCRSTHYGEQCQHSNFCRGNPCLHEGNCINAPLNQQQAFTCVCQNGYTGSLCENHDFCASSPCLNDGICLVTGHSYRCQCKEPYVGKKCEGIDYCLRNPCLNGGVCRNLANGFECLCLPSHHGRQCEVLHPCRNDPCLNGGICTSKSIGVYSCECPPTHYGSECQMINSCYENPCLNGGTCIKVNEDFVCQCAEGFHGNTCSLLNQCTSMSCLNGGTCKNVNGSVSCLCPLTHRGPRCQFLCNICLHSVNPGKQCNEDSNTPMSKIQRWYYNKESQTCQQFTYHGCEGNANNFNSRQSCRQRCVIGACCLARISSNTSDVVCRRRSINQCKRIHVERNGNFQVTGFVNGERCLQSTCGQMETCIIGGVEYEVGSSIPVGCKRNCSCQSAGILSCPCSNVSVRKELRQLTASEMKEFQAAVRGLKMTELEGGGNVWNVLRDEYAQKSPIAQSVKHFLMWNRAFLKRAEMLLQKSHCDVTIPYFDFTLDAGSLIDSVLWQPIYFGGEGNCIPDHPFRIIHGTTATSWEPCLVRHFNSSVSIPNIVDVAMAVSSRNFDQLSRNLLNIVSYVKSFIGGDTSTTSCAYDPVFYPIHAFIDHLYMQWQKKNLVEDKELLSDISMGFSNDFLKSGACVSYTQSDMSQPCNRSTSSPSQFGEDGYNLHGFNADGFDRRGYDQDGFDVMGRDQYGRQDTRHIYVYSGYNAEGYNRAGYDRRGFNRHGYQNGYNRDGFNTMGFNQQSFDRYGLDSNGFDKNGFNIYGSSQSGVRDQSDFYDDETGFSDCCFTRDGFTVSGLDRFGFTAAGYNHAQCNYFFTGPHSLYFHQKLWEILSVQPMSFLATLPRNCKELQKLPNDYLNKNWIFTSRPLTKLAAKIGNNSTFSRRFCFDLDILMTWCPCLEGNYPAICHTNPCHNLHCQLHPTAKCHVNVCGDTCSAEFYSDGRLVNCDDPCTSNPCLNGGTCYPSPYSSASERFSCKCPPEYAGSLCEQQTADTCSMPKVTGDCTGNIVRWYYNYQSSSCEAFHFSGCGGNANNFPNKQACQLRCSFGACCYKRISNASQLIGFDPYGFDKYGFNSQGFNRAGQQRSQHNSMPYGNQILGHKGFGPDGYNIHGYDKYGYDKQGYNKDGYHKVTGYNRMGYNRQREYDQLTGYDVNGYDREGFDRSGYKCNGLDRYGYNRLGYYGDYLYECRSMSLEECDLVGDPYEVVAFSPGQTCDEVNCGQKCGCEYNGKTYRIGQSIDYECQTCKCTLAGTMDCVCRKLGKRKEIRDLTPFQLRKYSMAVQKMYLSGEWDYYVSVHSQFMKTANGGTISLPWHRHYLASVERELRKQSDCDVSIPYLDWTIDVGSLNESYVWSVKYFGGNGEDENNCVKYHSFGGPNIWHPCVRRNFNMSVSLPDAVDLQILLHESNYEAFRIQLETVAALFHVWVGGHMISPFSPYDPLFLSHWAFMDHLWNEWQMKSPSGTARFPTADRYKLLEPFDVTVDDVLSSQKQICITYVSPTIGSPCNSTTGRPILTRNHHGYDRHGFDTDGFDVEGFNAFGRNRQGNSDERSIYDHSGYLASGYKRSGFDSQGWDIFGFKSSDFNRDGIDTEGYDQSGYNQFGFNRNMRSPLGMFQNGTYDTNVDIGHVSSLFNQFGYNKYGYNKYGLDYDGYSAFGYNTQGFDKDRCNFYHYGPHYMRYFYLTLMQLKKLQPNNLLRINRICKPVTLLPRWIAQGWLGDWRRVHTYQKAWTRKQMSDSTWVARRSSVTDEGLWLPVTPDQQFCMDLQWYSGCPLGTPMIVCQNDICEESRCASHPQAQCRTKNCGTCYPEFYNGTTGELLMCFGCIDTMKNIYAEGLEWERECETCLCQGGMISCNRRPCPGVSCTHPVTEPNQCCESCLNCEFNGVRYRNGQHFSHGTCETCHCMHGSVTCRTNNIDCPPTPCINPIKRPGECCPSCPIGCDGHTEGQRWMLDACHICNCTNNMIQCSEMTCGRISCSHPITPQSQCCPTCDGCNFNGRSLQNGQQFSVDGCARCTCAMGNVKCISQQCRPLECQRQITPLGSCCPVCEQGCEYEGRFYSNGESFHPLESSCRNCTCLNNKVQCHGTACLSAGSCPRPEIKENSCCPECNGCSYGEHFYRNHQAWTSDDGCERCMCQQGNIACQLISPCQTSCTHGIKMRGECCSRCLKCAHGTNVFNDGDEFIDENNLCQRCICESGNITCIQMQCPTLTCRNQQVVTGECCPQCQSCFHDGAHRSDGEIWRLSSDPCTSCSCVGGLVTCENENCGQVSCDHPTISADSCCQICDGCLLNGVQFVNGGEVSSGVCDNCICVNGTVSCTSIQCPELPCLTQVTLNGECCPSCVSCTFEGQKILEGAEFVSPRNPCLKCVCEMGETQCHRIDSECPTPPCSHPGRVHGECCRKCTLCEYKRRNYRNGEIFNPPHSSPCLSCTCMDGTVTCSTETCPTISCQNPHIRHGECCPSCTVCVADGVSYDSGSVWFPDSCSSCTCDDGVIKCHLNDCPPANCTHPANVPGYCCPSCEMCSFADRLFSNHQQFTHPQYPCQLCSCESGSVTCTTQRCRRAPCENAVVPNGECCPSCPTECTVTETLSIQNGGTALHPEDKCMLCSCTNGVSECNRQCSSSIRCSHPTNGQCCRDNCDGCFYRGSHFNNGESFHHAINPCRMCQCNNGNVRCFRKRCPAPSCSHPQITEDRCCPVCPETSLHCKHKGHTRENMERFADDCKVCTCSNGEITCQPKSCPSFSCTNPRWDGCCRRCGGCLVNNIEYDNGEELTNYSRNSCESCTCNRGNVICLPKICPPVTCVNPIHGECCPQCQGCLYNNVEYEDGTRFRSTSSQCQECVCSRGSVSCKMELCLDTSCTHPVPNQNSCCPVCGGSCTFNNLLYEDGYVFDDPSSDCRTCVCNKGSVQCNFKQCPDANCRNPVVGECTCSVCGDCMYNGMVRRNRETFTNPEDARCSECYCQDGNVVCGNLPCPSSTCTHPTLDICGCPDCDNCLYFNDVHNNTSEFPDAEDTCNTCVCQDGNVECTSKGCIHVECQNPSIDGCGCPTCSSCNYMGIKYNNHEQFIDSMNKCNQCTCRLGTVYCNPITCPSMPCSNPVLPIGECCSRCIGSCLSNGVLLESGAEFISPNNPCSRCSCSFGTVTCVIEQCHASCTHPLKGSACCPDCSGCLFGGQIFQNGDIFTPDSNNCQQCLCSRGSVNCHEMQCPSLLCSNPQPVQGQCCPECPHALSTGSNPLYQLCCIFHHCSCLSVFHIKINVVKRCVFRLLLQ
uniref:Uncharacterized protein LOC104265438 n=1 Tax=Phallusia mammillata TaxID=59560 RepID=A0A6F9DIV0_9ASCI|nr:uncharacterized protein LOC104265438 [Phallusia mammillata]